MMLRAHSFLPQIPETFQIISRTKNRGQWKQKHNFSLVATALEGQKRGRKGNSSLGISNVFFFSYKEITFYRKVGTL